MYASFSPPRSRITSLSHSRKSLSSDNQHYIGRDCLR